MQHLTCCCGVKAATDNMKMNKCSVFNKTNFQNSLQKPAVGRIRSIGLSFLTLFWITKITLNMHFLREKRLY